MHFSPGMAWWRLFICFFSRLSFWCDKWKYDEIIELQMLFVGEILRWNQKSGKNSTSVERNMLQSVFTSAGVSVQVRACVTYVPWCFRGSTVYCIRNHIHSRTNAYNVVVSMWKFSCNNWTKCTFPGPLNFSVKMHEKWNGIWNNLKWKSVLLWRERERKKMM